MPRPTTNSDTNDWLDDLRRSWGRRDYQQARTILNKHGFYVPPKGSGAGRLLKYAFNFAHSGASAAQFRIQAPKYDKYWKQRFGGDPNDRPQAGSDRTRPDRNRGNGRGGNSGGGNGGGSGGSSDVGVPNVNVPGQTDYRQFMISRLMSPAKYAKTMTDLEYGGALNEIGRLIKDEKRRGGNVNKWVDQTYDPLLANMNQDVTDQSNFNAALQGNYQAGAGAMADLFGNDQGAAAGAASAVAQDNLGQMNSLAALQAQQGRDAVGEVGRMKVFRKSDMADRSLDRLTELRNKMMDTNAQRRSAYNKYLNDAQFMKQRALSGAVDIAGALQNQNLAQAMARYQLQQASLDTTAMADQINMNRQNQAWTDAQNAAAMQQLNEDAGIQGGFVPWKNLNEGQKRSFMESILGAWIGQNPETGQPGLNTDRTSARQMVLDSLKAAGYNVKGNAKLRRWVDTYIASLPQEDRFATDQAGIGGSY